MRASVAFGGLLALTSGATAQYLNQTAPFALVVISSNTTYNGSTLAACHEGAAIESLCIGAPYSSGPLPFDVESKLSSRSLCFA